MKDNIVISSDDFRRLKAMIRSRRQDRPRIGYLNALERELRRARIVLPKQIPRHAVTMNTTVRFCDLQRGERDVLTVVYPHEAWGADETVSVLDPLGTAILGTRVGDIVLDLAAGGVRQLEIEKIIYQPEAAGDLHL